MMFHSILRILAGVIRIYAIAIVTRWRYRNWTAPECEERLDFGRFRKASYDH